MLFNTLFARILVIAGALAVTGPANATITKVMYRGVITLGRDHAGLFGTPNVDLTGTRYVAIYSIDDAVPVHTVIDTTYNYEEIYGGTSEGFAKSPMSVALTINGITFHIGGDYSAQITQQAFMPTVDDITHYAENKTFDAKGSTDTYVLNVITSTSTRFVTTRNVYSPPSYVVQPGDGVMGGFDWEHYDNSAGTYLQTFLGFAPTSVEVLTGVPEPSSLVLFIAALTGVGAWRYRKRPAAQITGALYGKFWRNLAES